MAATLELEVATPERLLLREPVVEANVPGRDGYLGVLPQHAPLLGELGAGVLRYTDAAGATHRLAVSGGFVEVQPDRVRVLANRAERAAEIDIARAEQSLKRALDRVGGATNPSLGVDLNRAMDAMLRAQARIDAARG